MAESGTLAPKFKAPAETISLDNGQKAYQYTTTISQAQLKNLVTQSPPTEVNGIFMYNITPKNNEQTYEGFYIYAPQKYAVKYYQTTEIRCNFLLEFGPPCTPTPQVPGLNP